MRGWPSVEILGVGLALALMLVPLSLLTGRGPESPVQSISEEPESPAAVGVFLTAKFAHPPTLFEVRYLDQTLWSVDPQGQTEFSGSAKLAIPKEGVDLILKAKWPEATPKTALEMILEPDELQSQATTHWAEGELQGVATYQW